MISDFTSLLLVSSIVCFSLNFLTLVCFTYIFNKQFTISLFLKLNFSFAFFLILLSYSYAIQNNITIDYERFIISVVVFFQLNFILFNIINSQTGSLRVRIIEEIYFSTSITLRNIKKKYTNIDLIEIRILRLIKGNQLRLINNRLVISSKFILFVFYIFHYLKLLTYQKSYNSDKDEITV